LSKKIDATADIIKKAIIHTKQIISCQFDLLHPAEKLEIIFITPITTSCSDENNQQQQQQQKNNYSKKWIDIGNKHRLCSQVEALSTIIEDPNEEIIINNHHHNNNNNKQNSNFQQKKRNRPNALDLESDESDNEQEDLKKGRKEQSNNNNDIPNFGMNISLDELKRAAGASAELLAFQEQDNE
jgi:hypothetical protein